MTYNETERQVMRKVRSIMDLTEYTTDEQVFEIASAIDDLLSAAFELATILYSPFEGLYPDKGYSPAEAVDSILLDIAEAAPMIPEWSRVSAQVDNGVDLITAISVYEGVDEVVQCLFRAMLGAGWVTEDELGEMGDEVVSQGVTLLGAIVCSHGTGFDEEQLYN